MTNTQTNEKKKALDEKNYSEKKPLKDVLASYLEKKQNGKQIIKIKKDLLELNLNATKAKTSVETLLEVQKKINLAYNNISGQSPLPKGRVLNREDQGQLVD